MFAIAAAIFLMGQQPVFRVAGSPVPPLASLPLFLVLGLVAGIWWPVPVWLPAAGVGMGIGATGWFAPELLGGGGRLVETTLTAHWAFAPLLGFLLARFVMTMLSYGTGTAGGIFAPLLVIGAQAGLTLGLLAQAAWPGAAGAPSTFAVVGMGALFAAIVRAPLTGIVLILEMTENYQLMLPLLAACFTAYALADLLRDEPIYEALLERDLLRGQAKMEPAETLMLELRIEEDAPFDGRSLAELGLPPGCLVVTVQRRGRHEVPTRDTVLRSGDQITAVVAPSAADAVALLRRGVEKH